MSTAADRLPPLNPDLISAIHTAAAPLQVADRGPFLETIRDRLRGQTALGEGLLHRVLAEAQAEFLQARPLVPNIPRSPKYGRASSFTRRAR